MRIERLTIDDGDDDDDEWVRFGRKIAGGGENRTEGLS